MEYVIRPAKSEDKAAIAEVYTRSWKYAYKGIVPQNYLDGLSMENYLERHRGNSVPGEVLFEADGNIIGLAKLIDCRDRCAQGCAEIQTIYFLPAFIGRGFGGILLEWLRKDAKGKGYGHMIVWVLNDNKRARRAYEKAGFVKDKARLVIIGGRELKETRYIIDLKQVDKS